jgi:UDP-GlcNAc:undecaprenyl-phosphate/decaprenyl-phosphate GlcNAc-1-phosphate transferase
MSDLKNTYKKNLLAGIFSGRYPLLIYIIPFLVFVLVLRYYIQTRYGEYLPTLFEYLVPALLAFFVAIAFVPCSMKIAHIFNVVDKSSHRKGPIPLLGGVGIFAAFITIALLYQPWTSQMKAIILASTIIMVIGTIDDIRPLSSILRLFGQLLAAAIVIAAGIKVSFYPHNWWGESLAILTTVIWILGIVNATNFVDGVDGLATGFTVIAAGFFFLIAIHLHEMGVVIIASILIGSSLGFLLFNFNPAKIYLGDGGSTFLGFLLACLALYGGWSSWNFVIASGIPILILSVLIFDMVYITISRIKNGQVHNIKEWLDYRGDDHFHHRLIHLGFQERTAVIFIYLTSIIMGLSALIVEQAKFSFPVVVSLIQASLIFINITILMLMGRKNIDVSKN